MEQSYTNPIFALASRYSSLVEAIVSDESPAKNSEKLSSPKALALLRDQTYSMLLSSTYMRLLSIFSGMLETLEWQLSQRGNTDGAGAEGPGSFLPCNQPVAEAFLLVNVMQFHTHRIGRSLDRLTELAGTVVDLASNSELHDGRRSIVIPRVLFERHAAVLDGIGKLRAGLLDTPGP